MSSEDQAPEVKSETRPDGGAPVSSPEVSEAKAVTAKPADTTAPHTHAWWKNTYFWLAAILFLVGIGGLVGGPMLIRDPGQKREDNLVTLLYFVGAVVMVVNGWLSHRQTLRELEEDNKHG